MPRGGVRKKEGDAFRVLEVYFRCKTRSPASAAAGGGGGADADGAAATEGDGAAGARLGRTEDRAGRDCAAVGVGATVADGIGGTGTGTGASVAVGVGVVVGVGAAVAGSLVTGLVGAVAVAGFEPRSPKIKAAAAPTTTAEASQGIPRTTAPPIRGGGVLPFDTGLAVENATEDCCELSGPSTLAALPLAAFVARELLAPAPESTSACGAGEASCRSWGGISEALNGAGLAGFQGSGSMSAARAARDGGPPKTSS
jgi:hypothetical protein